MNAESNKSPMKGVKSGKIKNEAEFRLSIFERKGFFLGKVNDFVE